MRLPRVWTQPDQICTYMISIGVELDGSCAATYSTENSASLRALLDLLDEMDPEVLLEGLAGDSARTAYWLGAVGYLRHCLAQWTAAPDVRTVKLGARAGGHPLSLIYKVLEDCPETAAPKALTQLSFINNPDLRRNVATDLDSLAVLFRHELWKATAVVAGSVTEAILLAVVEGDVQKKGEKATDVAQARKLYTRDRKPLPLEEWGLDNLIKEVSARALLGDADLGLCRAAQHYRNLIHPGNERTKYPCDEGCALAAMGGVRRLVAVFGP